MIITVGLPFMSKSAVAPPLPYANSLSPNEVECLTFYPSLEPRHNLLPGFQSNDRITQNQQSIRCGLSLRHKPTLASCWDRHRIIQAFEPRHPACWLVHGVG